LGRRSVIEPGEKVQGTAKVDFSDDPTFAGRLRLDATGRSPVVKKIAVVIYVEVEVKELSPNGDR
jgi:hypothetical protein